MKYMDVRKIGRDFREQSHVDLNNQINILHDICRKLGFELVTWEKHKRSFGIKPLHNITVNITPKYYFLVSDNDSYDKISEYMYNNFGHHLDLLTLTNNFKKALMNYSLGGGIQ